MAQTLTGTIRVTVDLTYNNNPAGFANPARLNAGPNGSNSAVVDDVTLSYGTGTVLDAAGAIPVNSTFFWQGTIAAGATKTVDLIGTADDDPFGVDLAFTVVKYFFVANLGTVAAGGPDGISYVLVGPNAIANAWQGPFGGVTAVAALTVYWNWSMGGPAVGWTVTAGTGDLFMVKNPGAADVTALIAIAGKK